MTEIAQKGCLLEGVTHLVSITPADLAVILHSDPDCANLVLSDARAADPTRFFCTNLEERDVLAGTSSKRLEEAIRWVADTTAPPAIIVVGSCASSMLADDIDAICERVGHEISPRLVPMPSQAFRLYGQAEILDRMTGLMAGAASPGSPRSEPSVNLLGYPGDGGEAREVLSTMGIAVNASPWFGPGAGSWEELGNAALNVVSDVRLFQRLVDSMDIPFIEAPPPFGLAAAERFHAGIASHFGREASLPQSRDRAAAALEKARSALEGKRLACHIGGRKDFALETVVREGLFVVEPLREMGLVVELLFQGAVERQARERIASSLEAFGVDAPFHPVKDRVSLTSVLTSNGYDAVHCSDSLREEVRAASIPHISLGSMKPGFRGVVENVDLVLGALSGGGP